ncbi:MAG: hypothetical protein AW08_00204 [Candidatus Accumulibacter adjunctus]|uniref:Uncharacterized protein n=1 Tax=Candidatus Accumulibacter adjunctus TaxID=1454001 RepID=A0A011N495_9PROT|nr:MAG: hypothetical protein AW08_00204 [Candidatus Accumulibacter adjunctus]
MLTAGCVAAPVRRSIPARQRSGPATARHDAGKGYFFSTGVCPSGFSPGFGASPRTVFSGQMEKAGHLLQPATMAIGHTVMISPGSR